MEKFPKRYIIGEEYINDLKTELVMKFYANTSCVFPMTHDEEKGIKISFNGVDLIIEYKINLSQKLRDDIISGKAEAYVWSYFNDIVPYINSIIQKNKYEKGQILCRAISMYDINAVEIFENSQILTTLSGNIFDDFKESLIFQEEQRNVFIRDYIDALTAKLYHNYEECLRRIITSIENFFIRENIEKRGFKNTLRYSMRKMKSKFGKKIIYNNLCYVYELRNKIVHDSLRIDHCKEEWKIICHMALGSLRYFFLNSSERENEKRCIEAISVHYLLIDSTFDNSLSRLIEKKELYSKPEKDGVVITNAKDFDRVMFEQMIISDEIKKTIYE